MGENRDIDDYDVNASFVDKEDELLDEQNIGSVQLKANATWQDMPIELEINGHTYKIEN